jgi:signal transduction histidine kinase
MISDIAHELRTPLSSLRGGLEGLIDGIWSPSPENISALHDKTLLLNRLADDLQQLAQADAGQLSIQKQPYDLRPLLQQIQATIGAQLEEEKITLVIELPEELPLVQIDVHRMEQVFLNLLSNAARHTPAGGTIRIAASATNDQTVQVTVSDTGPGLSTEDLAHVFERFYRADKSRARASGGSGLGLAITKALIEAHRGRIWAENSPDGGACFHFTLALAQPSSQKLT